MAGENVLRVKQSPIGICIDTTSTTL